MRIDPTDATSVQPPVAHKFDDIAMRHHRRLMHLLEVGQQFGSRYHILKILGIGGMGAVYQAWDAELGVAVALKVIRPESVWTT